MESYDLIKTTIFQTILAECFTFCVYCLCHVSMLRLYIYQANHDMLHVPTCSSINASFVPQCPTEEVFVSFVLVGGLLIVTIYTLNFEVSAALAEDC